MRTHRSGSGRLLGALIVAGVLALALIPAGCRLLPGRGGGAVRIYPSEEPNGFDPFATDRSSQQALMHLVYSGLVRRDARGELLPDLAEEVPTAANGGVRAGGRELRFRLRADAAFSDGNAVTASDAVATWRLARGRRAPGGAVLRWLELVKAVEAVDSRTVRVLLKRAVPWAVSEVLPFVLPERHLKGDPLNLPLWQAPVGSGPYRLAEWVPRERIRFEVNEKYHGPRPEVALLEARFYSKEASRVAAFAADAGPSVIEWLSQDDASATAKKAGVAIARGECDSWSGFLITTTGPFSRDPAVRRAMALAFPWRAVSRFGPGYLGARGAWMPSRPDSWASGGVPDLAREDTRAAAAILEKAGYRKNDVDGLLYKGEKRLRIVVGAFQPPTRNETRELRDQLDMIQRSYASVGVDWDRGFQAPSAMYGGAHKAGSAFDRSHDMLYLSFPSPRDPFATWPFKAGDVPSFASPWRLNVGAITDPVVQRAAGVGSAEAPERVRKRYFDQAAARLVGSGQILVDVQNVKTDAIRGVTGVRPSDGPWGDYWNVEEWRAGP